MFSSAEIWSNKTVKQSLYEYYGLALNIAALEMLSEKAKFTKQDIALLKSTLKDVTIPGFARIMRSYSTEGETGVDSQMP